MLPGAPASLSAAHRQPSDARSAERAFFVSRRTADVSDLPPTDPTRTDAPAPGAPARPATLEDRVRSLAEEAAEDSGLFIVGVSVKGHPGSRVVEVFAEGDGPQGAGIDDLAGLTRRLNALLDIEDPVSGRYRLDVSTPGADRPLSDPRQYPHHVGRTLKVTYSTPDGDAETMGTLTEATPEQVTIQPDPPKGAKKGTQAEPVVVPVEALREARVVLPW